ncbi:143_t:CDS:2, partial [Diversispora eburnea]
LQELDTSTQHPEAYDISRPLNEQITAKLLQEIPEMKFNIQKPKVIVFSITLNFDNNIYTLMSQEINQENTSKDIRDNKNEVENQVNSEVDSENSFFENFFYESENELDENQTTFDFNNELKLELDSNNNEQNFDYTCDKEINELISDNEELINKEKKSNVQTPISQQILEDLLTYNKKIPDNIYDETLRLLGANWDKRRVYCWWNYRIKQKNKELLKH